MKLNRTLTEVLGWYGVIAIVGAYALLSFEIIDAKSLTYQVLNATGALGVVLDAWNQKNWQPVVLNIFWLLIALYAILKLTI
jgi:hypothetical protein